jgi:hypothetical protein
MNITKVERKELDLLSREVFGSSTRWQRLIDKGYDEAVTEEVEETVPAEKEGEEPTKRKVKVPVKVNGSTQYTRKYHTIESVLEFMVEQKKQLDIFRAQLAKQKEEFLANMEAEKIAKEAKESAQQVQAAIGGSSSV